MTAEQTVRNYLATFGYEPGPEPFDAVLIGGRWIGVETFAEWIDRGVAGAVPRAVRATPLARACSCV